MDFWDVRDLYLNHEINKYQLQEIISYGLKEGDGTLKGVLPIFRIEEKDYKRFLNFLQKQGIKLKDLKKFFLQEEQFSLQGEMSLSNNDNALKAIF